MHYIVIILGILLILEIKFSPRLKFYRTEGLFNILVYYSIQGKIGYILRDCIHIKIKLKK